MYDLSVAYSPYRLIFREPAGTSRGILNDKLTFLLRITDSSGKTGYGEIPYFSGLSRESLDDLQAELSHLLSCHTLEELKDYKCKVSSVRFGIEQALADFVSPVPQIAFPSDFTEGKRTISINGLIWMGDFQTMKKRVRDKIDAGFSCIKIKIGAIDWLNELELIKTVRNWGGENLTIRVDANGAFNKDECLSKLEQLSKLKVHSIEQPIKAGDWEFMRFLCNTSPIPIALDEELIGIGISDQRTEMLKFIRPHYLILKPALCYGFTGCRDWISRADKTGTGWWITSALESSVGLDAIAQFTGTLKPTIAQGLGTGNLFVNNFYSPLYLKGENLYFDKRCGDYRSQLSVLNWIMD